MGRRTTVFLLIAACTVLPWTAATGEPAVQEPPAGAEDEEARTGDAGAGEADAEGEAEDQPRTVNLTIRGEEEKPRRLDVGGGWNEADGFYGRIALSDRNFLGRGEYLGGTVELGDRRERYELEYRKPWLFDRPQWLGVRLFKDGTEDPVAAGTDFDRDRSGAAVAYGRRLGGFQILEVEYSLADVEETESFVPDDGELVTRSAYYTSSSLRTRWRYDTLDSRVAPFAGLRLDGSLEVAGGLLGGEAEHVEPIFGLTWFRPLSKRPLRSALSARTRLGWIGELGGELFPQQRLFLGGERSVRGFRRRSISVLDDDGRRVLDADGFPLGGDRLAQLNLEYHLLPGGPFRLVLFADAGGVFTAGRGFDLDRMRTSAGAELWIHLRALKVPLRVIYATNFDPRPDDRFDDLSVSFGVRF